MQKLPAALALAALLAWGVPLAAAPAELIVNVNLNDDSIKFDQRSVHAGKVRFVVTNTSIYDSHEMVLVVAGDPSHPILFDANKDRVVEVEPAP